MKKTTKIIAIILVSVIATCGLGYLGLYAFVRTIYNQRSCVWANIDNIEMHANIDIPKIKDSQCKYIKEQNVKMSHFDIDNNNVDMDRYINLNKFKKLKTKTDIAFEHFLEMDDHITNTTILADLYFTKGSEQGETWQTLFNKSTGKLWVTIRYED